MRTAPAPSAHSRSNLACIDFPYCGHQGDGTMPMASTHATEKPTAAAQHTQRTWISGKSLCKLYPRAAIFSLKRWLMS